MTICKPSCKKEFTVQILEEIHESNTPCIKITGADVDMNQCKMRFDKEKIILEKCHFIGGDSNSINVNSCKELIIKNCTFENFLTRTLILESVDRILIKGCKFKDCKCEDRDDEGGVIYSSDPAGIGGFHLIDSLFVNCGFKSRYYRGAGFVSNITVLADNCRFVKCWHNGKFYPDDERLIMFTQQSSATNCTYEDSARFN